MGDLVCTIPPDQSHGAAFLNYFQNDYSIDIYLLIFEVFIFQNINQINIGTFLRYCSMESHNQYLTYPARNTIIYPWM